MSMRPLLFVILAALLVVGEPRPKGNGLLPTPQLPLTRLASASCGGNSSVTGCHRINPFLTRVQVDVGQRVLSRNQATTVTITGSNPGVAGTWGGFAADVTAGTLAAGANTRTSAAGDAITHVNAFATGRSWTFGFKAPGTAGPTDLYTVVNSVNGNGRADGGDEWGFHSAQILASESTPVRLYTNADGVAFAGAGCADGYGNVPVLGGPEAPALGNGQFRLEALGLPASAPALFMLGLGGAPAIDLGPMGDPGCVLRSTLQAEVALQTGAGSSLRGEGRLNLALPIPNQGGLKGLLFHVQIAAVDGKSQKALPLVLTNAVEVTIQ